MCHHGQDAIEHDKQGNEITSRCRWCPSDDCAKPVIPRMVNGVIRPDTLVPEDLAR